jgi:fatty-acyl-CoA synthase
MARDSWMRALQRVAFIERNPNLTLPFILQSTARHRGSATALSSRDVRLSYTELVHRCNQYSRWGIAQGLRAGDTVALLMHNCPDYLAIWLGLVRIGVAVSLQNTHLSGAILRHSIEAVPPRLVIAGAALTTELMVARRELGCGIDYWVHGASSVDMAPLEAAVAPQSTAELRDGDCTAPQTDSVALYIYTSGTTGLPKAARVSHYRLMQWSHWFSGLMDVGPEDIMYDCLPLYHSVGGVVATTAMLVGGGAVVIRERFSASDFWRDIRDERCTLFQYIGELCRYLVNAPEHPAERDHRLRLACGNGLRAEVWRDFEARFRIPRILEYYAATEANFSLYNCEGEPGAIGRIPPYLAQHRTVALLRVDIDTGEPLRNSAGFCEACRPDEAGEAVARMPTQENEHTGRFEGYAGDGSGSAHKVLRDVFSNGDSWYRSGDLMRRDARGFYYFVDRIGDTFRWKGENVSTVEVAAVLSQIDGVLDAAVYGVAIPGTDGRAGMAALVVGGHFDLSALRKSLVERLPAYARPLFFRLLPSLQSTGTFKPVKRELVSTGFDPAQVADPLYFDSRADQALMPLNQSLHADIVSGRVRL